MTEEGGTSNWLKIGGCACGCLVIGISLIVIMSTLGVFGAFGALNAIVKSSEPYQEAMALVQADPALTAALGTPIEPKGMISGSISTSGPTGEVDVAIPIEGPNGSGKLFIVGDKSAGRWSYTEISVELESGERIEVTP